MNSGNNIYHEKQHLAMCAVHSLNNLFQEEVFTKEHLNNICNNLSPNTWINPHKSCLGIGNYDINVIMRALNQRGHEVIWFDKRTNPNTIDLTNVFGFILNVPADSWLWLSLFIERKHWLTIKNIGVDSYYNLDSKLEQPALIGNAQDLLAFLQTELQSTEKELFIVNNNQPQNI